MELTKAVALEKIEQIVFAVIHRHLSPIQKKIIEGCWEGLTYDQIAAQNQYSRTTISNDEAPNLWKLMTQGLGEKVTKFNFKEVLKKRFEKENTSDNRSQSYLIDKQKNHITNGDFYVSYPQIESLFYDKISQPGSLIRLKAPSLMGKTRFVSQIFDHLANQNYRTVSLSFKLADKSHFMNLNKLLRWFCKNVSRQLQLSPQLDDYWDEEDMGSKVSCTTYFEDYLLTHINSPLALCLDDVDWIFPYPEVREDFFGLLRSWYEKAQTRNLWKKLRLVIVHSTEVYIQLNINQSPFNVGVLIELPEFSSGQIQELAHQYSLDLDTVEVEQLINMVGGHPYLIQQAISYLKSSPEITLSQLLQTAATESGIYSHHLREHLLNLRKHPELIKVFKKVVDAKTSVRLDSIQAYQLYSMGLIKWQKNEIKLRCNLYHQYFCDRLEDT